MEKKAKKHFTQKELEKHINTRLVRERKKNPELMLLRKMTDELIAKGIIDANSYAEAAERIMTMLDNTADGNKEEDVSEEAKAEWAEVENTENTPKDINDLAIKQCTSENDNHHSCDEEADAYISDRFDTENGDSADLPFGTTIEENSKEVDDGTSEESGNTEEKTEYELLSEICNSLMKLVNSDKERKEESVRSARRAACSTGFSGERSADAFAFDTQLTPLQREIAKSAGLSYREYARLLGEIPENTKKRKQRI